MNTYANKEDQNLNKVLLRNNLSDNTVELKRLESLLTDFDYQNTQYMVIKSDSSLRLEIRDDDSQRFDRLVNELYSRKMTASADAENLTWF